ncbi:phosphate ABC transporter substrate-binding protein [Petrotoga miotherma DSM 10691]|uniref:Phosphate-binding protein n=2 Tax=Petrotoga TaxID=28236 RepID=A0A2K1PGA2_9BACT|nr:MULTISPECIES: phosphate ABC transporter substrate-binding protein PstS family protein [Petrotoga]MDK2907511.1 phosphate transport system substrate-binding protein [Petrotoga sp.]PNS01808.1 phosphate ABC transporter substrate-binding protein [Petrotoga miotherma DSM 10691]POZ89901.1 phosphate ABC transporter substrate-binding protein [Petrotoga halophila DSM 16923]
MKKVLLTLVLVGIALFSFAETLVIKGSNTIFPVAQLWIEELKDMYPNLTITLEGAGSSTGIAALFNGTTDIADSSRWLKESELEQMHEEGKYFIPIVLGYDGIAVIVNPNLGIDEITIEELASIYTGEITRWSQLNPNLPNQRIVVYSRNTASGTYETFVEKVLEGERMAPTVQMLESTHAEVQAVAQNSYAIAYTGVGYVTEDVKVLSVEGVQPTKMNILNSVYPISRPLYMFVDATNGYPQTGPVKQYLTFGLSKRGQELVEQAGYVAAYGF